MFCNTIHVLVKCTTNRQSNSYFYKHYFSEQLLVLDTVDFWIIEYIFNTV